jgi:cyclophilin family peptidyl-prolyl cis-trans isomerase
MNQQLPSNRRQRRQDRGREQIRVDRSREDLPGMLRFITHPKVFAIMGIIFMGAIVLSLFVGGLLKGTSTSGNKTGQMNEAEDKPAVTDTATADGTPIGTPAATVKRYTAPPPMVIDTSKTYVATIKTSKGDIQIKLDPSVAPDAVNAFVFLAKDGYYTGTPFMEVAKNSDGSKFTAQAGDPTQTGLGTPGFDVKKQPTQLPFDKGAVGIDSGQFFISYGDYPALTGRYTIVGHVVSGMDVLDKLSLLDVRSNTDASGDTVQGVTIAEQ